ncbi:hypothetical protein [Thermosulfurimonas sp. F29]|uniref:[protein-PII] uridylyltransferase family protein n=1 Tax=Thermosulfurimonas sp. F29 TaxID=2867247 RepID=UPI001C836287|nr:hypothetical protein [Thermosulfurimonas sp. F29]MBX6423880.1 hypothetical protein [Thermosulfurimonas sp. F29]
MRFPEVGERYLERLRENLGEELRERVLSSPHFSLLLKVVRFSPYAANLLSTREEVLRPFLEKDGLRPLSGPGLRRRLSEKLTPRPDFREAARILRLEKQREVLKILALDLRGAPFERTVKRISRLAEGLLRAALEYLCARHGIPEEKLLVLAFGKFGGRELNYASDIDLAYFHTPGLPKTAVIKLFEELTRLFDALVEGDRLWRVDLRLRPGGKESELSLSLPYAREYYLYRLHPFERLALIRARPVAGNLALGYRFLADLRPVIYPRYLDFAYLEHIRELKERIRREALRRGAEDDIKIGEGGIREVEFLVQGLQSIYGGKHPELRVRRITLALKRLSGAGILSEEESRFLAEAYTFLRTVEHRLQTRYFQQTFRLPREPAALEELAAALGFTETEEFLARLNEIRRRVSRAFAEFLAPTCPRERSELVEELQKALLSGEDLPRLSSCASLPEHLLRDLHRQLRASGGPVAARRAAFLRELLAPFLEAVLESSSPPRALSRGLTFFERLGGRFALFAAFRERPDRLKDLLQLLTISDYLWSKLETHPALAEVFFEPGTFPSREDLRRLLSRPYDEALTEIRTVKEETLVRTAVEHLQGKTALSVVLRRLTRVAEGFTLLTYEITRRKLEEELSRRLPGTFAVLALGKLGAREMGYRSDLDLIFVYEGPGEMAFLSARLAQRFLSYLSLGLPAGEGYPVDARLRPEGRKGPLTTTAEGLLRYWREEADLWELVAATRLRFVAGDRELGHRVEEGLRKILSGRRLSEKDRKKLLEMRLYMERERAREDEERINPKVGRGALADLEFLAALARLETLAGDSSFAETHTPELLELLPEGKILRQNYYFLREVGERLILLYDPKEEDPVYSLKDLSALEVWLGPGLRERYETVTEYNRRALERHFLGGSS